VIDLLSRWIGLTVFSLLAFAWMGVYGPPETAGTALAVGLLAVLQAYGGYRLGLKADRLRETAYLDSLTGVLVHRRFTELLQREVERARRNSYPVTLLFIDLDNFKIYNDKHGHLAGDNILCQFANLLCKSVREQDTVGRWGGEEFVVLLPHTNTEQAVVVGERIQRNVRKQLAGVTVSIGLASFPAHADSATELAAKADMLMYEAKKQKDCMLVATSENNAAESRQQ
jgi:diguanylate cyclase (GGDEF)-like protein